MFLRMTMSRPIKRRWPAYLVLSWVAGTSVLSASAGSPLRVHPGNPRYFTDGTMAQDGSLRAIYLTGSHTWGNLCDYRAKHAAFDYSGIRLA